MVYFVSNTTDDLFNYKEIYGLLNSWNLYTWKDGLYTKIDPWYFTIILAWRQTPETGSGVIAFTDLAAQVKMQKCIYWYTFCHL